MENCISKIAAQKATKIATWCSDHGGRPHAVPIHEDWAGSVVEPVLLQIIISTETHDTATAERLQWACLLMLLKGLNSLNATKSLPPSRGPPPSRWSEPRQQDAAEAHHLSKTKQSTTRTQRHKDVYCIIAYIIYHILLTLLALSTWSNSNKLLS